VLRFDGGAAFYLGPPSDEKLKVHPLYRHGIAWYTFHEVLGAPCATDTLRHRVLTLHDESIEEIARAACVHSARVDGEDTRAFVDRVAGRAEAV
jgi:hypothetical protein